MLAGFETRGKDEMGKEGTRWRAVLAIVGAGVVAALQVGKLIIAAPLLRKDLGLDLASIGALAAVFSLLGMFGGIAAGGVITRYGARRMLLAGLAATAAGAVQAPARRPTASCWRRAVVEAAGLPDDSRLPDPRPAAHGVGLNRDFASRSGAATCPPAWPSRCWPRRPSSDWRAYWWCAGRAVAVALVSVAALAPATPPGGPAVVAQLAAGHGRHRGRARPGPAGALVHALQPDVLRAVHLPAGPADRAAGPVAGDTAGTAPSPAPPNVVGNLARACCWRADGGGPR